MCGIVGAVAERNVEPILLEGLKRLEYRGYDSAGMAIIDPKSQAIQRHRVLGKVSGLADALHKSPLKGLTGIAHTRWATHGQPNTVNAHPHLSQNEIAVVHNGIIENHEQLRQSLTKQGYRFESETDTEVIGHLIHYHHQKEPDLLKAISNATEELKGAYALGIIDKQQPGCLYAVRCGSPLVVGLGIGEHFIASDPLALLPVTRRFIYLEEGDISKIELHDLTIFNSQGEPVTRAVHESNADADAINKGKFRHFMQKEIFEQPEALSETISPHIINGHVMAQCFGHKAPEIFAKTQRILIVACGTSYHAGLVAKYWLESIANIPCQVEIASENRYRKSVVEAGTLMISLSQSGETADTLAALRQGKKAGCIASLGICNVPESSMSRETDLLFITRAGTEVGVAATKTFTAQLSALLLLTTVFAQHSATGKAAAADLIKAAEQLPKIAQQVLKLDDQIKVISKDFADKNHALFLGRGEFFPIALEGALKLKEISYLHAEAYPAGELKHGPLALVDENMPIIVLAPKNNLIDKLESNIQEVQARDGRLYIFIDETIKWTLNDNVTFIKMPTMPAAIAAIAYTIPMQLLAYHIAVLKGTDVDQPRNLAKSVTVE